MTRPRSKAAAAAAMIAGSLILTACTTSAVHPADYVDDGAELVFTEAFSHIRDKYIESVPTSDFAYRGIENLSDLDPALKFSRENGRVRIVLTDGTVAELSAPDNNDARGWASLTVRAITAARKASPSMRLVDSETVIKAVFDGAMRPLDHHSRYAGLRSARDHRAQREGFGGIGIRLAVDDNAIRIIGILPGTPAEESTLQAGDILTHVDGMPLSGQSLQEAIWRLRGPVGSSADLIVVRSGESEPFSVSLKRALVVSQTVYLERKGPIAVINITGFNQRTSRNLDSVLNDLSNDDTPPKGLILDLRGNPGGLLDQAVMVADAFLSKGRIVSTRGRHPDSFQLFNATMGDLLPKVPMVVLVNGQSASAAEIVAAALQDQGRAVVVGSNTYGKGTVQNITRLSNEGELILTWSRFHAPSGYALEQLGVLPNICTIALGAPSGESSTEIDQRIQDGTSRLAAWRLLSDRDLPRREESRNACQKRAEKPDVDVQVAEWLLDHEPVYAKALSASEPLIAHSPGAWPPQR